MRPADRSDLPQLVVLSRADCSNDPMAAARIAGLVVDPMRCIAVAESSGDLVGLAEAQFYGTAMRRDFGSARMHDLFVKEAWRRRGIGAALFAEVRAWAEALPQCRYLEWQSSPTGMAFYEQMGLVGNAADDSNEYPFFEIEVAARAW